MSATETQSTVTNHQRRRFQYSLRTLFVTVLLFALVLGWLKSWIDEARIQSSAVAALGRCGAGVVYNSSPGVASDRRFDSSAQQSTAARKVDEWLRFLLFGRVVAVHFYVGDYGQPLTDALARMADLPHIQLVDLDRASIKDVDLVHLRSLHRLRTLYLWGTKVGDAGIANIADLQEMRRLGLQRTLVTDAGVEHLRCLKNLDTLNLAETQVTDECVQHLAGLKQLRCLDVSYTRVSERGVARLRSELPQTWIIDRR